MKTTPLQSQYDAIMEWDRTRSMARPPSRTDIARKHGMTRETFSKYLEDREAVLERAEWEGLPVLSDSPPMTFQAVANHIPSTKEGKLESVNYGIQKLDILWLPDGQVKAGNPIDHWEHAGKYTADKKPDVIVNGGDFADMPSCSTHDEPGSRAYSEQNYKEDILSVHHAMKAYMTPILAEMARTDWKPRFVFILGNHEDRINRMIERNPKLDGTIGLPDLEYERWGWEVQPFLKPITIGGIVFCHYFPSGTMGRPITSAQALLTKKHQSCVAGHQQGRDIKYAYRGDGKEIFALIAGSFYKHDEGYLNHQTNLHYRGLYMLYGCEDGTCESQVPVTIDYLERTYG